jgi:hypothetical protein
MYACNLPVHLMKRNLSPLRREGFRGIFSETQTSSEKTSNAGLPYGCYLLQLSLTTRLSLSVASNRTSGNWKSTEILAEVAFGRGLPSLSAAAVDKSIQNAPDEERAN